MDDNRAATHTTPGAMVRSRADSGPMPSGNRLTTITKKIMAARVSARRRSASLRSRTKMQRTAASKLTGGAMVGAVA